MKPFPESTLEKLLNKGILSRSDTILTVCAGRRELGVFQDMGFENVTITNLDVRVPPEEYAPFDWNHQDVNALTFDDGSFDFCFVLAGLHHSDSPHKALLEMYRVARKGVIVLEARDSWTMRIAARFGLVCTYELEAVVLNDYAFGGVNNTAIPNYVYRWTEREFEKTIKSHDPTGQQEFIYHHALSLPHQFNQMSKNPFKILLVTIAQPVMKLLTFFFKKQMNHFALVATKPKQPWPWLERHAGTLRLSREYSRQRFKRPVE